MKISIITPCYNEGENVEHFYRALCHELLKLSEYDWEWIIVDDHSDSDTVARIHEICMKQENVKHIRLAKNRGSHVAAYCGIQHCTSDFAIIMSMDLQDHPSYVSELLNESKNAFVVWARRNKNYRRDSLFQDAFSKVYYKTLLFFFGKDISKNGADFFLIRKKVVCEIKKIKFTDINIIDLVHNLGFESRSIYYDKKPRLSGSSKWTLSRKISLFINSIILNSALPLRIMGLVGFCVSFIGFYFALRIFFAYYNGHPYPGWTSLIVAILIMGGLILINLSIIGEYIWRIFKNTQSLPVYSVEYKINFIE